MEKKEKGDLVINKDGKGRRQLLNMMKIYGLVVILCTRATCKNCRKDFYCVLQFHTRIT